MNLLPLFPLDVVLLPSTSLPLHIFEPRYQEMTGECLAQKKPFGVVRAREEGISEIGCTAAIVTLVKQYSDGRSDIVTQGGRRFEIMRVNQERSFLQAEVLYLEDEPGAATSAEVALALKLQEELAALAGTVRPERETGSPLEHLSFRLAGPLPLDLDFKQNLLAMKSEAERLRAVIAYFQTILPGIKRGTEVRKKAGGNGHAL